MPLKGLNGSSRRRRERFPIHAGMKVVCPDSARPIKCRIVDISEHGAAVLSWAPLPCGSLVHIEVPRFQLYGSAYVSHCSRKLLRYFTGLEFKGVLTGNLGTGQANRPERS